MDAADEDDADDRAGAPPAFGTPAYYRDIERQSRLEEGRAAPRPASGARGASPAPPVFVDPADDPQPLELMSIGDILAATPTEPDAVMEPILPMHGLAILYSGVGAGKTWLSMAIALAVAAGGTLFDWRAPRPRRVLYIDNETPRSRGVARLQRLSAALPRPPGPDMLQVVWGFDANHGLHKLDTLAAKVQLNFLGFQPELTVVDSLGSMVTNPEAVGAAWHRMQDWLNLRRRRSAVLVVHHANDRGSILGGATLKRPVDSIVSLKPAPDWRPQDSVAASVRIEKARDRAGPGVRWLDATLNAGGDAARWTWRPLDETAVTRAAAMLDEGRTPREIAADLAVSRALAYRFIKRAIAEGLCEPRRRRRGRPRRAASPAARPAETPATRAANDDDAGAEGTGTKDAAAPAPAGATGR